MKLSKGQLQVFDRLTYDEMTALDTHRERLVEPTYWLLDDWKPHIQEMRPLAINRLDLFFCKRSLMKWTDSIILILLVK